MSAPVSKPVNGCTKPPLSPKECKAQWKGTRPARCPTTSHELLHSILCKEKERPPVSWNEWLANPSGLSTESLSDHGLDSFWYYMNMKVPPSKEQKSMLLRRLYMLLLKNGPYVVARAVETGTLHNLLGADFFWVVYPFNLAQTSMKSQFGWTC